MYKQRALFQKIKPYLESPEAIIITGMRRTGKTTLLDFLFRNSSSQNKIILDLENPLNRKYFEEPNYETIKKSFEFMGIDFERRPYIFLDEIQFVDNLPSVAKYFMDHYQVKFFLTGSAGFYLKNLFSESLAGRKFLFELNPLTFREFLKFKDNPILLPENQEKVSETFYQAIIPYYKEYFRFGGFPGVVLKTNTEEKIKSLEDIFTSFYQNEVLNFSDFRKNKAVRDLIILLAQRIASKVDVQKLSSDLKISRPTLYAYLDFLEGTFFLKMIKPLSKGKGTSIRKNPKVYFSDTGLARYLGMMEQGRLFENLIYQNLVIKGNLNYFQKKSGVEIDFILNHERAFEVKVTPRAQDVKRLERLALELNLKSCHVISYHFSQLDRVSYGFVL